MMNSPNFGKQVIPSALPDPASAAKVVAANAAAPVAMAKKKKKKKAPMMAKKKPMMQQPSQPQLAAARKMPTRQLPPSGQPTKTPWITRGPGNGPRGF